MLSFKQFIQEERENVGYHYGDLQYGRDTVLGRMPGRSTGHFGTGVYFLSKPMANTGRDKRPIKKVDLSKFKLARPYSAHNAKALHDALKLVNRLVYMDDKEEEKEVLRDASFKLYLALTPTGSQDHIKDIIEQSVEKVQEHKDEVLFTSEYAESASTLVMKKLGYDGIDVRGIPEFDNTDYGTVVYARELTT